MVNVVPSQQATSLRLHIVSFPIPIDRGPEEEVDNVGWFRRTTGSVYLCAENLCRQIKSWVAVQEEQT